MSDTSLTSFAVPAAGIALGAFLVAFVLKDMLTTVETPPCSGRFPPATEFALRTAANTPLSAIELQGRAGAYEWGVLENAKVVAVDGAPAPLVMQVRLPKGSSSMYGDGIQKGGLSFRWEPQGMRGAKAACLRYAVFVPDGFDFGAGGELPGVFGGKAYQPTERADGENGFASRIKWSFEGQGGLSVQAPDALVSGLSYQVGAGSFQLPRGRWATIEQETVLNTPDKPDGIARLWLDGVLKIEYAAVVWRKVETLTLSGVVSDVWYGGIDSSANAPADAVLGLTPLSVSWK